MFKRIIYDDWAGIIPIVSFWLTFGVFIAICIRALLLKKSRVEAMKQLPFEEDSSSGSARASSHCTNAATKKTQVRTEDGDALPENTSST